jgi:3'(2'), 5'-bisphosphate nucleotidase
MLAPDLLLPQLLSIADRAGAVLLEHYASSELAVATKADRSPVTAADEAAEQVILAALRELTPEVLVVAEEEVARDGAPERPQGRFWLVDPLDGTREFISRNGEFTVNIGLVEDGLPVLGVVTAPARGLAWWGAAGLGAWRRETAGAGAGTATIRVRQRPESGAVAVASRSHRDAETDRYLAEQGIEETVSAGSSLKFCLVAEGKADVYPRFGTTMEWDTAAGHAVLRAAGGSVRAVSGEPLTYGKPAFRNPGFVAEGA